MRRRVELVYTSAGLVFVTTIGIAVSQTMLTVKATPLSHLQRVDQPLRIELSQKLKSIDTRGITMTPSLPGSWKFLRTGVLGKDYLEFTPESYFTANTSYTVTIPESPRVIAGEAPVPPVSFTTESAPSLADTGTTGLQSGAVVAADHTFRAELVAPNRDLRKLTLRTTPKIATKLSVTGDQHYAWQPVELLPQGTEVNVEIYDEKNHVSLYKRSLAVASEPHITTPASRSHLGERTPVEITFDQPIADGQDNLISFDTAGEGAWKDESTYVFTPAKLTPGQSYSYEVKAGLRSKPGGIITTAQNGTFTATGPVWVTGSSPNGRDLAQSAQTVSFTFDQPVDRGSAESRFSISHGTVVAKSWRGDTLQVRVENLGFQQSVTATIAAGVVNSGFGLPSNRAFSIGFTTEARTTKLNVPHYRQQYSASCTGAVLRMILAYRGIATDDMGVVQRMGYAPRDMNKSTDPPTWDDPDEMFVGSVNGSIAAGTGAGADAGAVAKAARSFGRSATPIRGASANWIADHIHAGNPVVLFGATRNTGNITWQTPTGRIVTMNQTGHVYTVYGVVGEPSNPIGFWVHDPLGGSRYWSVGEVNMQISRDAYRQAVAIH